jgi:CSLREA domain-containing protein
MRGLRIAAAGLVAATMLACGPASADTFKPTRFDDPNPGKCKPDNCSLREAISAARKDTNTKDKVALAKGHYIIERPDDGNDDNGDGDFDVFGPTVIVGKGKKTIVDGNGVHEVFTLLGFDKRTIRKLTITGGVSDGGGAGISMGPSKATLSKVVIKDNTAADGGGGILSVSPDLTIKKSTITANTATSGPGGGISIPTGIVAAPHLTIRDSTVSHNTALVGGGLEIGDPTFGSGGAPIGAVTNSTFAENKALGDAGGIAASHGATLALDNTTVGFNIANSDATGGGAGGGINQSTFASFELNDSVLASNSFGTGGSAAQCAGDFSGDENVVNAVAGCSSFNGGSNLVTATLIAESLDKNGGPTQTMDLPQGSPALGFVELGCPSRDQRGRNRPDEGCDAGAYERTPKD